ncbi:MAG: hypothetical protein WKF88_10620 [Ferruginibacter sp.]
MKIKIIVVAILFSTVFSNSINAQIKIEDVIGKVQDLLGKKELLTVKKGFSPVFSLGRLQINNVGILGEKLKGIEVLGDIFNSKGVQDVTKLYKTYKTGLVVFKVLAAAGAVAATYSTVRGIAAENKFNDKTVKALLLPGITSVLTGVVTKVLTKKASYKAVDIFNGVVRKKIKDILSVAPASSNMGVGIYVKL